MRLITTLSLGAATLALAGLCASAQPLRTAAAGPAVPAAKAPKGAAAFTPAPAAATPAPAAAPAAVATATPAPASAEPAAPADDNHIDGIAATVGDNSVSDFELNQRVQLAFATAGFKPGPEDIKRMRKIQLENLIDEHIQLTEARKRKITVSPVEVDKTLEDFAKSHGSTVPELTDVLAKAGSSIDVLRAQQTSAIAWRKVVMSEFADDVVVSPAEIDDALKRAAEGANKPHYRPVEIFLPVDNTGDPAKEAEVKKQMEDIEAKAHAGTPFRNLAQQYSRDPSAAAGGDMGWVYDGQLDPDLNAALAKMHVNELSHPIRAKGGWYLLGLTDRQEPLGTDVATPEVVAPTTPPGTLPLARLLLPMPRTTPPEIVKTVLRNAGQIRDAATSCEMLETISKDPQLKDNGAVYMSPLQFAKLVNPDATEGYIKLSDVSEDIQKALAQTKSGEVAAPFQDDAGIEIIARCEKRAGPARVAFTLPSKDDVQGELFQEKMSANMRRYMRDLRRQASIQERNDNAVLDAALIQ
jgi:peptidyl-prolyl cis-trans isomerase SurA